MKKWIPVLALYLSLLLSACNLTQDNSVPEGKPGALYTQAAMTVAAQFRRDRESPIHKNSQYGWVLFFFGNINRGCSIPDA